MEKEEKKDVVTAPEKAPKDSPEELAKKLRDKNDLRTFGIAFMAALIVVALYHIGRMVHRQYFNKYRIKACRCRFHKHSGKPGPRRGKPGKPGKPQKKDGAPAAQPAPKQAAPAPKPAETAPKQAETAPAPVSPAGEQK